MNKKKPIPKTIIANGERWVQLQRSERWEGGVGDVLVGAFLGFQEKRGSWGGYRAALFQTLEGKVSVNGAVLVSTLEENDIGKDDLIRVVFTGTRVSAAGHTYKTYDVFRVVEAKRHGAGSYRARVS